MALAWLVYAWVCRFGMAYTLAALLACFLWCLLRHRASLLRPAAATCAAIAALWILMKLARALTEPQVPIVVIFGRPAALLWKSIWCAIPVFPPQCIYSYPVPAR